MVELVVVGCGGERRCGDGGARRLPDRRRVVGHARQGPRRRARVVGPHGASGLGLRPGRGGLAAVDVAADVNGLLRIALL